MTQTHESVLVTRVLGLLANMPRHMTLEYVAGETGLPHRWLARLPSLRTDESTNVIRLEKLYSYLSGVDVARLIK